MVKIMEHPIKLDDLGGPPLFLETPIFCELACFFASGTLPTAWIFGTVPRPTEDCTPERDICTGVSVFFGDPLKGDMGPNKYPLDKVYSVYGVDY